MTTRQNTPIPLLGALRWGKGFRLKFQPSRAINAPLMNLSRTGIFDYAGEYPKTEGSF